MRVQLQKVLLSMSFLLTPCLSTGKSFNVGTMGRQPEELLGGLLYRLRLGDLFEMTLASPLAGV